jgi:hypothetical protein
VDKLDAFETRFAETEKSLKELGASDEEKVIKTISDTPTASMAALIARRLSAVGSDETRLRANNKLVDNKPKETQVVDARTGIPFIDEMLSKTS